jgi:hypothetical protein
MHAETAQSSTKANPIVFCVSLLFGTKNILFKRAGLKMSLYLVITEQTKTGLSAYSPDLPGV